MLLEDTLYAKVTGKIGDKLLDLAKKAPDELSFFAYLGWGVFGLVVMVPEVVARYATGYDEGK